MYEVLIIFGANADIYDIAMMIVKLGAYVATRTMVDILAPVNVAFLANQGIA